MAAGRTGNHGVVHLTARSHVTSRIERQARRFPRLALDRPGAARSDGLDPRHAALARAIERAVKRRWLTLAAVIDACLDQSWERLEATVRAPLLAGAAQLLLLDDQPAHAVINEAVEWTRGSRRPRAAGLVNAVLRKVDTIREDIVPAWDGDSARQLPLADGRAWLLGRDVFAGSPFDRLASCTSHPRPLLDRWARAYGPGRAGQIALHGIVHPPTIVNAPEAGEPSTSPHDEPGFAVWSGEGPVVAAEAGDRRVQDPTAAAAVEATRHLAPTLIVDACAGKGTKTRQLARLHGQATVIATDTNAERLDILRRSVGDLPNVEVVEPAGLEAHHGRVDLLVLDVPCSNTGVLARRCEARYRFDGESLESLVGVQRQIIADHLGLLAPQARILYATCSIEPEENEQQVAWMQQWHDLTVERQRLQLPTGAPGDPPHHYRDGGFYAEMAKGQKVKKSKPGREEGATGALPSSF